MVNGPVQDLLESELLPSMRKTQDAVGALQSRRASYINWIIIEDQKAQGVQPQLVAGGAWAVREFNTVVLDSGNVAVLAANQITLPEGTYIMEATCPGYGQFAHKCQIYDATNLATLHMGANMYSANHPVVTQALVRGYFTLTAATAIELWHYNTLGTFGGLANNIAGAIEVYSRTFIMKVE